MTITTNLKLRDRRLIELLSDLLPTGESLKRLRQQIKDSKKSPDTVLLLGEHQSQGWNYCSTQ